jgi:hypothetical protein
MGFKWVGLSLDCDWAGPMARRVSAGFEVRNIEPGGRWA